MDLLLRFAPCPIQRYRFLRDTFVFFKMWGNGDSSDFITHQDVIDLGGLNSHQQRAVFLDLCSEKKLSGETIFAVYVLATVTRNRDELLKRFSSLPRSFRNSRPFAAAYDFIKDHMVGWAYEVQPHVNFSLVNVPVTNPTICHYIWKTIMPPEKGTMYELLKTSFATQLAFPSELMKINLEHQRNFWNKALYLMNQRIVEAKSERASKARVAQKEGTKADIRSK